MYLLQQAAVSAVTLSTPAKEDDETDVTEDETDLKQLTKTAGDPETVIKVVDVDEKAEQTAQKPEMETTKKEEMKVTEEKKEKPEEQITKEKTDTEEK